MEEKQAKTKTSDKFDTEVTGSDRKIFLKKVFKWTLISSLAIAAATLILSLVLSSFASLNPTEVF
jgi:hypothetical protein